MPILKTLKLELKGNTREFDHNVVYGKFDHIIVNNNDGLVYN